MTERLDDLMRALATAPPDRSLADLESGVADGVGRRRAEQRAIAAAAPFRVAAVGLALAIGVTAGGALTPPRPAEPLSPYSAVARLAPSSLLGDG